MSSSSNSAVINDIEPHVLRKYEILQRLGKGAYGVVWKAIDRKTKETVAVKKIFDAFQNATDAQRTFREIMFLDSLQHDNVIKMKNVLRAFNEKDIYIIFEYMETDLHAVVRARILEDIHKQYIIYQLLKTCKYLHSGGILHRDIKPSNLLLNSECLMKVADFGLARSIASLERAGAGARPVLTDYIATRWYRAPEILLGSTRYTKGVDLWSVGCILGELLGGRPMFPGTSTMNQLERIIAVTGLPSAAEVEAIGSPFAMHMLSNLGPIQPVSLQDMYPRAPPDALDMLRALLVFNPARRLTAEQALGLAYVRLFHNPADEPVLSEPTKIPFDDDRRLPVESYREHLYKEIKRRRERDGPRRPRTGAQSSGSLVPGSSGGPAAGASAGVQQAPAPAPAPAQPEPQPARAPVPQSAQSQPAPAPAPTRSVTSASHGPPPGGYAQGSGHAPQQGYAPNPYGSSSSVPSGGSPAAAPAYAYSSSGYARPTSSVGSNHAPAGGSAGAYVPRSVPRSAAPGAVNQYRPTSVAGAGPHYADRGAQHPTYAPQNYGGQVVAEGSTLPDIHNAAGAYHTQTPPARYVAPSGSGGARQPSSASYSQQQAFHPRT